MPVKFTKCLVAAESCETVGVFDVDGDGVLDIVSGELWYQGPDFRKWYPIGAVKRAGLDRSRRGCGKVRGDGFERARDPFCGVGFGARRGALCRGDGGSRPAMRPCFSGLFRHLWGS